MHDIRHRATLILVVAAAAVAACMAVVASASAAAARPAGAAQRLAGGNPWGTAQEVPGTAALNKSDFAEITSLSCTSAGNCGAGGFYTDQSVRKAFVVSEVNGTWRKAGEVRGTGALTDGHRAEITSLSCGSAGNCSAGGWYRGVGTGGFQGKKAFVVSEVGGRWRKAEEVPGTAALNKSRKAQITSVSCASAGNCSAGGSYTNQFRQRAFVVSEVHGRWQTAEEVPGTKALSKGYYAETTSVSCASAGNCSAGGTYVGPAGQQAFVVSEVRGRWRKAEKVPGTAALNVGRSAEVTSVSCASAGNCSAGGYYIDGSALGNGQAFTVSEVHGTWRNAEEVPGTAALNTGDFAEITSVSCASAGNCSAGGSYMDGSARQVFVVSEVHGTWQTAEEVPGTAALNTGASLYGGADIVSVSCASAGNCSTGGDYQDGSDVTQAFVVSEVNGIWQTAEEVPGTLSNGRGAQITSVSCGSPGHCSAGGSYTVGSSGTQAFVVSRK